jgi:2-iminobutanoate/2-iminopropanoate deaminase
MDKRRSINVEGARHVNPIPSASQRGPFVVSGAISGSDPATGTVPEDLDAQCRQMFANVRRVITAAGGTPDDIIKMNMWITDRALRPILNKHWTEMFPDAASRPARHTLASTDFTPPMQIQCDLLAVIDDA